METGEQEDSRTMREVRLMANSINPDVVFMEDVCSMLNFCVWGGGGGG